jgi:hypothetical protein
MAVTNSGTLLSIPRRGRSVLMSRKKRLDHMFSHDA